MEPKFKTIQLPENWMIFTNYIYINSHDLSRMRLPSRYVQILSRIFCVEGVGSVSSGCVALSQLQRVDLNVELDKYVSISNPGDIRLEQMLISELRVNVNCVKKCTIDCRKLDDEFKTMFSGQVLYANSIVAHKYSKSSNLMITIKCSDKCIITRDTTIVFETTKGNVILKNNLGAKKAANGALLNINFEKLGIGGLDKEFSDIFRRAFVSRVLPNTVVKKLGIKHIRGMILYGPPGCGKTLIARQISKSLKSVEPKIVSGPEILNKFVGESEKNIRELFADAERDQTTHGDSSDLHVIIFDEIDAICKKRGGGGGGGNERVGDSVVNQLLAKIDGVDSLNNILLIGMTNRMDMLDRALLRPGRFEVHIEIGLPDLDGRKQILNIHTGNMRKSGCMSSDIDLKFLAENTKNYTGAEIEGLVRSAVSFSTNKHVNTRNLTEIENTDKIMITSADFEYALNEIKPAFGIHDINELQILQSNGIVHFNRAMETLVGNVKLRLNTIKSEESKCRLSTVLIHGDTGCGKTALLANMACSANMDYTKMIRPDALLGKSEFEKASYIREVFEESYKSPLSLILIDDIERIIDYVSIGPRFSNLILQTLLVLINKEPPNVENKLMVVCASSEVNFMEAISFNSLFQVIEKMPLVNGYDEWNLVSNNVFGRDINTESSFPPMPVKQVIVNLEN